MAEYKPKLKDVALAAQTAGRKADYAIDGVYKLREEIANMRKHIAVIDDKVFKKMHYDTGELNADNDTYNCCPKLDKSIHIELTTFAKNKCPHCGSHNLHFTFDPDAFSDSTVNCRDCHNSWKIGGCAEDIDSPYKVANILRSEHRTLFEENKRLQEENEKLKKQAAIDASYMVTVEDLMARLKNREERIEALKQENNKLLVDNAAIESDNDFIRHEIDEYKDNIDVLRNENHNLKKKNEELHKDISGYRDMAYEFKLVKKALNIYQDITDLDVSINKNVGFIRFTDSDDAGRTVVKNSDLDTLCDAYCKHHQYPKKGD